ncbi:MAG TPA: hypothetical protein VH813_11100 [Candidatus Limnocylindrales bacterium]|jgi:hypothetical protein
MRELWRRTARRAERQRDVADQPAHKGETDPKRHHGTTIPVTNDW